MGSPCAPTYANLLLGWWEYIRMFGEELEQWNPHITFWGRFRDNILILWKGTKDEFVDFVEALSNNPIGLRFTFEIQQISINFLDLKFINMRKKK